MSESYKIKTLEYEENFWTDGKVNEALEEIEKDGRIIKVESRKEGNYRILYIHYRECRNVEDKNVLPLPCVRNNGKTFEKTTLREWLAKLHEEMTEMEEKAFGICGLDDYPKKEKLYGTHIETEFALECADVATVLASMQEAFGIGLEARNEAQRRVNAKNRERGRL